MTVSNEQQHTPVGVYQFVRLELLVHRRSFNFKLEVHLFLVIGVIDVQVERLPQNQAVKVVVEVGQREGFGTFL